MNWKTFLLLSTILITLTKCASPPQPIETCSNMCANGTVEYFRQANLECACKKENERERK